jgi:hypothetical protein
MRPLATHLSKSSKMALSSNEVKPSSLKAGLKFPSTLKDFSSYKTKSLRTPQLHSTASKVPKLDVRSSTKLMRSCIVSKPYVNVLLNPLLYKASVRLRKASCHCGACEVCKLPQQALGKKQANQGYVRGIAERQRQIKAFSLSKQPLKPPLSTLQRPAMKPSKPRVLQSSSTPSCKSSTLYKLSFRPLATKAMVAEVKRPLGIPQPARTQLLTKGMKWVWRRNRLN